MMTKIWLGSTVLPDFRIENFRAFADLHVKPLGRVSLVVGKNDVGKSSFLEALRLYASPWPLEEIRSILVDHDEVVQLGARSTPDSNGQMAALRLEALFHQMGTTPGGPLLSVGPSEPAKSRLTLQLRPVSWTRVAGVPDRYAYLEEATEEDRDTRPGVCLYEGSRAIEVRLREDLIHSLQELSFLPPLSTPILVPPQGFDDVALAMLWDRIALRTGEERVLECLRLVEPIERINLVAHPLSPAHRQFQVRMRGQGTEPIPLKRLGDGILRMLTMSLAVEASRGDGTPPLPIDEETKREHLPQKPLVLIDEIENGLHYSALPKFWRFMFMASEHHDLQLVATTHSWDCIEAFQLVAADFPACQPTLIRLEQRGDRNRAVSFTGEELAIATREGIEVR